MRGLTDNLKQSASHSSTAGPLQGSQAPIFSGYQSEPSIDHYARVSRSASNSTASSNYAQTLKSNLPSPVETLPSQYTEAPTSASLASIGHSYASPSLPTSFQTHEQINTSPPVGHSCSGFAEHTGFSHNYIGGSLERSRSYHTLPDYDDDDRYIKRPRASTSSAAGLYQLEDTASAYHQASRSFSEQPNHRASLQLPSLSEEYAVSSTEQVYMPLPQQDSASMTAPGSREPYEF